MAGYILGIDPGFSGSLAVYNPVNHTLISVIDMPLLPKVKDKKTLIDTHALADWIASHSLNLSHAVLEAVGSMPGQSSSSTFRFGQGFGIIQGILGAHKIPIKLIHPSVWKTVLGLSQDKQKSLTLAVKLFPSDALLFSRKKDDGRAEAALLAYLGGMMKKTGVI